MPQQQHEPAEHPHPAVVHLMIIISIVNSISIIMNSIIIRMAIIDISIIGVYVQLVLLSLLVVACFVNINISSNVFVMSIISPVVFIIISNGYV